MVTVNRVSAFQKCQNLSDVLAEGTKQESENSEAIKRD